MDAARRLVAAGHAINVMPNGMIEPYATALGLQSIAIDEPWAVRGLHLVSRAATTASISGTVVA
jgi:DNA-binding transcriptional LysR family regulator